MIGKRSGVQRVIAAVTGGVAGTRQVGPARRAGVVPAVGRVPGWGAGEVV